MCAKGCTDSKLWWSWKVDLRDLDILKALGNHRFLLLFRCVSLLREEGKCDRHMIHLTMTYDGLEWRGLGVRDQQAQYEEMRKALSDEAPRL